jgi:transposase InsO family protein
MAQICAQFGISRQAHYQKEWREVERQSENEIVLEMVRQVRRKHPRMGGRKLLFKIQPLLQVDQLQIGRDRLFELLRNEDLLVKRRKTYRRTTIPGLWRAPNRLPGLTISQPNQVWVCDITYLEMEVGRFAYLFVLMDLFARYILGWYVATSLAADGALNSLHMALVHLPQDASHDLIHHSDHGVQYTNHTYMNTLLASHIRPSMGAVGNCYDNIFAERLIGILKSEYCLDTRFMNFSQVNLAVKEVVHLYNTDRPHLSLNFAVPQEVYSGKRQDVPCLVIPETPSLITNN